MDKSELTIKLYADGADIDSMIEMNKKSYISGFTTNPTLMKKAGVNNYVDFATNACKKITDKPISFEVFSDDFEIMEKEAQKLSQFGKNIFVKIPITNAVGISSIPLIKKLSDQGIKVNVTAILTLDQVKKSVDALNENTGGIISVFAGRIADAGVDPKPIMRETVRLTKEKRNIEVLWASCREVYSIIEAQECGVDIITVTNDLLKKMDNFGKELEQFSLETVNMFANDAKFLGFTIL